VGAAPQRHATFEVIDATAIEEAIRGDGAMTEMYDLAPHTNVGVSFVSGQPC
jgi:hypothetical protein